MKKEVSPKAKEWFLTALAAAAALALGLLGAFAFFRLRAAKQARTPPPIYNEVNSVSVAQRSFYPDDRELINALDKLYHGQSEGLLNDDALKSELERAIRMLQRLGYYYDYAGKTAVTAEGVRYGAAGGAGPIGGGEGYDTLPSESQTHRAVGETDFYLLCQSAQPGDVIWISGRTKIDISDMRITDYPEFVIPAGVTIASDRGFVNEDGSVSAGAVLKMSMRQYYLLTAGDGVRLTGLVLEGAGSGRDEVTGESDGFGIVVTGRDVEIDNCEISGFFTGGIVLRGAENARIHNNFIHDIQGKGNGFGILAESGTAAIEGNLFSNVNTAIFASNEGETDLTVRENVETGTGVVFFSVAEGAEGGVSAVLRQNTVLGLTAPLRVASGCKSLALGQNFFGVTGLEEGAVPPGSAVEKNLFGMENPKVKDQKEGAK